MIERSKALSRSYGWCFLMKATSRVILFLLLLAVSGPAALSQVKIAGEEIVPKGLIFADSHPQSRVTAEGELADGCGWSISAETRFAEQRLETDCYLDYRRTSVTLTRKCPAPAKPESSVAERTTTAPGPRCPAESGEIDPPDVASKAISSGTTPDGKRQAILVQADGTRMTMSWDESGAHVVIRFPDGTTDRLDVAAEKPAEIEN